MNRTDAEKWTTEYLKPVFGFSLKKCRSIEDAEDLSQEIMAKVYVALIKHDDIEDVLKFIWTIAHNCLSNYYRDNNCSFTGVPIDEVENYLYDETPSAETSLVEREEISKLYSEIAYLSKLQRRIVIILHSEKAFAYKMKMDALKKQGKRTDLTSDQVGPKLSVGEISDTDSASQVKRYIRLTKLIPKLLSMVDESKISFSVGVELSYLTKTEQTDLFKFIEKELCTPSLAQAQKLKKLSQEGTLNAEEISSIMKQPKPNQVQMVKIPEDSINKYMKSTATVKEKEDFLARAVEYYGKHLLRQKDRGAR